MCCPLVFEFSVGIGGFVIGLGQISFFFSQCLCIHTFSVDTFYLIIILFPRCCFVLPVCLLSILASPLTFELI